MELSRNKERGTRGPLGAHNEVGPQPESCMIAIEKSQIDSGKLPIHRVQELLQKWGKVWQLPIPPSAPGWKFEFPYSNWGGIACMLIYI